MSYTETDYKKFVKIRDDCSLCGRDFKRNIGRLEMKIFLNKFNRKDQNNMFKKDNKEHNIK